MEASLSQMQSHVNTSLHDWLMSLAMELAALCDLCGCQNGTNGCHLAVYSEDVTFACHFVGTHLLPCHSVGVLVVLATPVKELHI